MSGIEPLLAAAFVLIHLFAGGLAFLNARPRSRWLSVAGGMSVAYVFLGIFPELADAQVTLAAGRELVPFVERHAYLVALAGLIVFYGLEGVVETSRRARKGSAADKGRETTAGMGAFWLHIATFAVYNGLVGYLLAREESRGLRALLFYFVALAVHFVVTDHGLRQAHRETYTRIGRWLLAAAIVLGWTAGVMFSVSPAATASLSAFLAGGVVLNVLKEELPAEKQSRFVPFVLGTAGYGFLLLLG
jgi:hypothetical protein